MNGPGCDELKDSTGRESEVYGPTGSELYVPCSFELYDPCKYDASAKSRLYECCEFNGFFDGCTVSNGL